CGGERVCVSSSQWCDSVQDCVGGEDESNCFRLYGSRFVLQAYSSKSRSWKAVCSDGWNTSLGKTACEQIGYSSDTYFKSEYVNQNAGGSVGYMKLNPDLSSSGKALHKQLSSRFALLLFSDSCSTNSVVTLRCIDCGTRAAPSTRIVGGTQATLGQWPWQVSLHVESRHLCGGSIITPYWIVTAAHCVEKFSDPGLWTVYAGQLTQTEMSWRSGYSVSRIIANNYNRNTKNNDIALMKLITPLIFSRTVSPVCLPNVGLSIDPPRSCWISGWGATQQGGYSSDILMQAPVSLIDRVTCNAPRVYSGQITNTMICAGYLQGGIDSCQGDSGGPLVTEESSLWWLVGDTSWGDGCAMRNKPGVYGNMTVFLDWIYQQMRVSSPLKV
ncbi:TMPS2 protease, partial [Amia calva]|nr:TMPS2 protease [Amia calva]